jgi:hypothetical protein
MHKPLCWVAYIITRPPKATDEHCEKITMDKKKGLLFLETFFFSDAEDLSSLFPERIL